MTSEEKKELKRQYDIEYRKKNKQKIAEYKKNWSKSNPDKIQQAKQRNKENKKIFDKNYAQKNKEKIKLIKQKWVQLNPEKNRLSKSNYVKKKMTEDPFYKLKHHLSNNIKNSLKNKNFKKSSKTTKILGCSFEEFKIYLESKFESWMNWENYGNPKDKIFEPNKTWDIDHIIPLSSAKTEGDIIKLNHYTNLRPLCSYYNRWIKKHYHE